jgi:D-alanyl-D-alanine carboxypeptidase (penicillin-binding protein 5/6)
MGRWRAIGVLLAAVVAGTGSAPPAPDQPSEVPCPRAEVEPPPDRPVPPPPPGYAPGDREIGGPALASAGLVLPPDAPPPPDRLSASSWLVADLDTGAVLGACGAHGHGIPASTVKLLLALTLLDELDPAEVVEVTAGDMAFTPGSSAVGLLVGGGYPVETLWLGLLLNSGNDAANVLARVGGGRDGVPGTLAAMNARARLLGAHQTHAATPSGLDGPGQFTSAYDLALIARALFDHERFRRYTATERVRIPAQPPQDPRGFEIQNNNRLLYNYQGALGGKTGFTELARHAYVGAAQRQGRRLVVTLLGAERQPAPAWRQGAALLDWGFSLPPDARVGRLVEPGETLSTLLPPGEVAGRPGELASYATATARPTRPATVVREGWSVATVAIVAGVTLAGVGGLLALVAGRRRAGGRRDP